MELGNKLLSEDIKRYQRNVLDLSFMNIQVSEKGLGNRKVVKITSEEKLFGCVEWVINEAQAFFEACITVNIVQTFSQKLVRIL